MELTGEAHPTDHSVPRPCCGNHRPCSGWSACLSREGQLAWGGSQLNSGPRPPPPPPQRPGGWGPADPARGLQGGQGGGRGGAAAGLRRHRRQQPPGGLLRTLPQSARGGQRLPGRGGGGPGLRGATCPAPLTPHPAGPQAAPEPHPEPTRVGDWRGGAWGGDPAGQGGCVVLGLAARPLWGGPRGRWDE